LKAVFNMSVEMRVEKEPRVSSTQHVSVSSPPCTVSGASPENSFCAGFLRLRCALAERSVPAPSPRWTMPGAFFRAESRRQSAAGIGKSGRLSIKINYLGKEKFVDLGTGKL
jgi:hypothetical protein